MRKPLLGMFVIGAILTIAGAMPAEGGGLGGFCPVQTDNPGPGTTALRATIVVDFWNAASIAGCPTTCPPQSDADVLLRVTRGGSEAFFRSRQVLTISGNTLSDYQNTLCQIIQDPTLKSAILNTPGFGGGTSLVITNNSVTDFDGPPTIPSDGSAQMFIPNVSPSADRHIISMLDAIIYATK